MILLYLRFTIITLLLLLFFIYGLILVLLFPFNARVCQHLGSVIGIFGSRIMGMEVEVRGKGYLRDYHPCIYICNHQTNYDMFVIGCFQPYRGVSIGKRSLLWIPFFGVIYWLAGNILINRKNKKSAWNTMVEAGNLMEKRNSSLFVMPEGTRSRGKGLAKFKKGAFTIAIATGKPIIPIVISSYAHFDFRKWRPGKIIMQGFPPIETKNLTAENITALTEQSHLFYQEKLALLDKEINDDN